MGTAEASRWQVRQKEMKAEVGMRNAELDKDPASPERLRRAGRL